MVLPDGICLNSLFDSLQDWETLLKGELADSDNNIWEDLESLTVSEKPTIKPAFRSGGPSI